MTEMLNVFHRMKRNGTKRVDILPLLSLIEYRDNIPTLFIMYIYTSSYRLVSLPILFCNDNENKKIYSLSQQFMTEMSDPNSDLYLQKTGVYVRTTIVGY